MMDGRSDQQRRDQERTHPRRNNETDTGFQQYNNITEQRLKWYGRIMSRYEEHLLTEESAENG